MSLWYDKKGKTYATKGSSSWVKYYAEHLVQLLTGRLESHYTGGEGKHHAEDVLVKDSVSVADALATKVDKEEGKGLSQQDYTLAEKRKLASVEENATAVGVSLPPTGAEAFNDPQNDINIPYAHLEGRKNTTKLRTFLITSYTKNTVTLDSVAGIEPGMNWFLLLNSAGNQSRYSGTVVSVSGNTVTLLGNTEETKDSELDILFTPETTPGFYGTFFVNGGSIGSHIVTDFFGDFSCHLEGRENQGTLDAHAEGLSTRAMGYASHAEGKDTKTGGECSHAEGYGTKAEGIASHAEGGQCCTSGFYAHAEGGNTTASGKCSHAEGAQSLSRGNYAHAEGLSCIASGESSHAEGSACIAQGKNAHAEGSQTRSHGENAHTEGYFTNALGLSSHAEGGNTSASGNYAHSEGYGGSADGNYSHKEGCNSTASANSAHAEGNSSTASGLNSHAEGYSTRATGAHSHAEGQQSHALATASHAEGSGTRAASSHQHVQGVYNEIDDQGLYADIVGNGTSDSVRSNAYTLDWEGNGRYAGDVYAKDQILATKKYVDDTVSDAGGGDMLRNVYDSDKSGIVDNAERLGGQTPDYYAKQSDMENTPIEKGSGLASAIVWDEEGVVYGSTAKPQSTGAGSFAANFETRAKGFCASAFGSGSQATGEASFSTGSFTTAKGDYSFASGLNTHAENYQAVVGKFNNPVAGPTHDSDVSGSVFLVGTGIVNASANSFRVGADGQCYAQKSFVASGTGYAEFFEWADQNVNLEDRRGYFVTLEGKKIRKANEDDTYVLGVVSSTASITGNSYSEHWQGLYQADVFGRELTEVTTVPESIDAETGETIPAYTVTEPLLTPDFFPTPDYKGRNERPEWAPVGMLGQLVVVDDGSCTVDGFCKVAHGGIATHSDSSTPYRVLERLDETHIRILLK